MEQMDNITSIVYAAYSMKNWHTSPHLESIPNSDFPYYRFLYHLSRTLLPKTVVEVGVYKGISLAHIAAGCAGNNSDITGVDHKSHDWAEALKPYGVGVLIMDSLEFLTKYDRAPINLLHIDTEHTPEHVNAELEAALPKMAPGGVICIDDITINDDMRHWWHDLPLRRLSLPNLHQTGYGVILV